MTTEEKMIARVRKHADTIEQALLTLNTREAKAALDDLDDYCWHEDTCGPDVPWCLFGRARARPSPAVGL